MSLEKNIELWVKVSPREALQLSGIQEQRPAVESIDEANVWFESLSNDNIDVIYIYGVGEGNFYLAAEQWLHQSPKRSLVFLDDDLTAIHHLFTTPQGEKILTNPQVHLRYFSDLFEETTLFNTLYWNFSTAEIQITAHHNYKEKEIYTQLAEKITYTHEHYDHIMKEYLNGGATYYNNFYRNLLSLPSSYLGNALFDQFKGIPAVICGAGPSLTKQIETLKTLKERCIIFAGGSAMNILNSHGFNPHFGAGVDPNPFHLTRLSTNTAGETPFFYRNRMYWEAFQCIQGPRLYVTGSGGYDTAKWFEEKLGIAAEEDIDEGQNVVTFCLSIAKALGCHPIIFVGMDLAYTNEQTYAPGIEKETQADLSGTIPYTDIFGNPTYTLWKWIAEAKWIGEYAEEHSSVKVINATEGGIGFPNVENISFKKALKKYCTATYDLSTMISKAIAISPTNITEKQVAFLMQELRESLIQCQKILSRDITPLAESDLTIEPAYHYVLGAFDRAFTHFLKNDGNKYQMLKDVAKANIFFIDQAIHF